jgi:hypothetical protein
VFGDSQIEALRDLNAQVIIAKLNLKLPGSRETLEGHLELGAVPRRAAPGDLGERAMDASPLSGPGEGRAILKAGDRHFHLKGRAAHARFGAQTPRLLRWLRAPLRDEERWLIEDEGGPLGVIVDVEGRSRELALRRDEEGGVTSYWGDDELFLRFERDEPISARPLGGERLVQVRAPISPSSTASAPGEIPTRATSCTTSAPRTRGGPSSRTGSSGTGRGGGGSRSARGEASSSPNPRNRERIGSVQAPPHPQRRALR